jgi:hypothetical protein
MAKLLGIIGTAFAHMLDAEIQFYMLRSLTTGRGENLLTEDNAPGRIWQGNNSPGSDAKLDVARLAVVVAPPGELCDYLSLPFDASYADFQTLTLLVVSFCCRSAVTDPWPSCIAVRVADT